MPSNLAIAQSVSQPNFVIGPISNHDDTFCAAMQHGHGEHASSWGVAGGAMTYVSVRQKGESHV
jgi:hypothetical protein